MPKSTRGNQLNWAWLVLFMLPLMIGLGLVYFSAAEGLAMGFTDWDIVSSPRWIGFANFSQMWSDPEFWQALRNTLVIALVTVPIKLSLGLLLAVLLQRKLRPANAFLRLVFFYPATCSVVAIGLMWRFVYDADGLLNRGLMSLGLDRVRWLGEDLALTSICVLIIWEGFGYATLIYLAGLANIPKDYYDASHVDGANEWQQFRYITLPLLTPTTFFLVVISVIAGLQTFGEVYLLEGPSDSTLTIVQFIYQQAFTKFSMGYAAAVSWVLISLIMVATFVQLRLQKRWVTYDL